jgi:hypothetical protein
MGLERSAWPARIAAVLGLRRRGPQTLLFVSPTGLWSWPLEAGGGAAPFATRSWTELPAAFAGLSGQRVHLALSSRLLHTEVESFAGAAMLRPAERLAAARARLVQRHGAVAEGWPLAQSAVHIADAAPASTERRGAWVAWHGRLPGAAASDTPAAQWAGVQKQARRSGVVLASVRPWWAHWIAGRAPLAPPSPQRWLWLERESGSGVETLHLTDLRFDARGLAAVQQRRAALLRGESGLAAIQRYLAREGPRDGAVDGGGAAAHAIRVGGWGLDGHGAFAGPGPVFEATLAPAQEDPAAPRPAVIAAAPPRPRLESVA